MAGLARKVKNDLAYLYELDEFKSFKKLCDSKRDKLATQIFAQDMSQPGASHTVAMLQGQYHALEYLQIEMKKIHQSYQKEINKKS